jgi:CheY-like chemotaxis protein
MQLEENFTNIQHPGSKVKYNHIMLIDDNPIDNLVNKQLIENGKFTELITVISEPLKALDVLKNSSENELPDLIFLDILMPVMDGFQFLDEFEKLGSEATNRCKIVMLSTSDSFQHLNKANKNKFVRKFLHKPLTSEMMEAIINH